QRHLHSGTDQVSVDHPGDAELLGDVERLLSGLLPYEVDPFLGEHLELVELRQQRVQTLVGDLRHPRGRLTDGVDLHDADLQRPFMRWRHHGLRIWWWRWLLEPFEDARPDQRAHARRGDRSGARRGELATMDQQRLVPGGAFGSDH